MVAALLVVITLCAFILASLCWGVDSREDFSHPGRAYEHGWGL